MYTLTQNDVDWLIVGLLPLLLTAFRVARSGAPAALSLISVSTIIVWTGYHLTPWLSLRTNGWASFLLYGEEAETGIIYSTYCMYALCIGYGPLLTSSKRIIRERYAIKSFLSRVKEVPWFVPLALVALACLATIVQVGGFQEFLYSTSPRGEAQWVERSVTNVLWQHLATLAGMLSIFSALVAGLKYGDRPKGTAITCFALVLVLGSCNLCWGFSRGSGACMFVAALGIVLAERPTSFRSCLVVFLIVMSIYFGAVGFTQRNSLPGVLNFVELALTPDERRLSAVLSNVNGVNIVGPKINFLNALDAFTARLHFSSLSPQPPNVDGWITLIAIVTPIPSVVLSYSVSVGESLTTLMGTTGATGLTTPALAELWILVGWGGGIPIAALGFLMRQVDRSRISGETLYFLVYLLFILSEVLSLHSGLRAMTRPLVYAGVLLLGHAAWLKMNSLRKAVRSPVSALWN